MSGSFGRKRGLYPKRGSKVKSKHECLLAGSTDSGQRLIDGGRPLVKIGKQIQKTQLILWPAFETSFMVDNVSFNIFFCPNDKSTFFVTGPS